MRGIFPSTYCRKTGKNVKKGGNVYDETYSVRKSRKWIFGKL